MNFCYAVFSVPFYFMPYKEPATLGNPALWTSTLSFFYFVNIDY